jgi:hypothetical protein
MTHPRLIRGWLLAALLALGCASPDLRKVKPLAQTIPPPSGFIAAPPLPSASVLASAAAPEADPPSAPLKRQHLPPPSPRTICQVRWSADGATVATVDAKHVRVRARDAQRWSVELEAPLSMRFIDVSLVANGILEEGPDGRRTLVSLKDGHAMWPRIVAHAPWARLSEDGTKLLAVEAGPYNGLDVPWFFDLRTGKKQEIWIPSIGAVADPVIVKYRRNTLQIDPSQMLTAFLDIRHAPRDADATYVEFGGGWNEGEDAGGIGLPGVDVDNDFQTIVLVKMDWAEKSPQHDRAKVEVYQHIHLKNERDDAKLTAEWPIAPHSFRALWLSPEGRRLILRTEHGGKITHAVWDTDTGKHLGDIALTGDCFDFSPDGKLLGEKRGDDLAILKLP